MLEKYQKIIKNNFSRRYVIIIICLLITLYAGVNLTKEVINRRQVVEKIKQYQDQVTELQRENKELSAMIDSWSTGGQLEKEARLKLGLQKPGEKAVLIVKDGEKSEQSKLIDADSEVVGGMIIAGKKDTTPNWKKWWQYFFK